MSDYTDEPPERHSLLSELEMTANGYAQAVQPLHAQTMIVTDTQNLRSGTIRLETKNGWIPAYFAAPETQADHPIVLVVQEIFGLHEHIKDVTRRLAKNGYFAVAADLFARQGDATAIQDMESLRRLAASVPDAQVIGDLDAALDWASQNGGDAGKVSVTGFCWGGRIVWLYAAHQPKLRSAVAWYGRLSGQSTANQRFPIDVVEQLQAPVLGLYGTEDEYIPPESIDRMRQTLAAAHPPSRIQIYPEAAHGFFADYRSSYRPQAAADAWRKMLDWFEEPSANVQSIDDAASNETWEAD